MICSGWANKFMMVVIACWGAAFTNMQAAYAYNELECANAWYARNLIAHRGGQCFSTVLGKAMFGNNGCSESGPRLSQVDLSVMKQIANMEKSWQCRIDTSRKNMNVPAKKFLDALDRMPVRGEFESSCLIYQKEDIELFSSPSASARVTGILKRGMNAATSHEGVGDWTYLEVGKDNQDIASGWTRANIWDDQCKYYAG